MCLCCVSVAGLFPSHAPGCAGTAGTSSSEFVGPDSANSDGLDQCMDQCMDSANSDELDHVVDQVDPAVDASEAARRYKKRIIFVTRTLEEYLSVEVPAAIETMNSFVLRVEGLSDDQCRRNAGFTVRRAVVHMILRWLMENNVVWSQWREDGRLSWNAERFEAVTDGLLHVPVVGTAEAGLTMLRGSGPADDAENCDDVARENVET